MRKDEIDPLAYIEGAFIDTTKVQQEPSGNGHSTLSSARPMVETKAAKPVEELGEPIEAPAKLKKTGMRAPRPRRAAKDSARSPIPKNIAHLIQRAPHNLTFLASLYDDSITQRYYSSKFKESREELIRRMLDPELNLEDTARLLGVCPATVRRYTNRGWLKHHRTNGNQRRFTLSGIVEFVEAYGRNPE
jgi:hypothetical protein